MFLVLELVSFGAFDQEFSFEALVLFSELVDDAFEFSFAQFLYFYSQLLSLGLEAVGEGNERLIFFRELMDDLVFFLQEGTT